MIESSINSRDDLTKGTKYIKKYSKTKLMVMGREPAVRPQKGRFTMSR